MNGLLRGKRVAREALEKVYRDGVCLPMSLIATDITGNTVEETGLGYAIGDEDRVCKPVPGTLRPVGWSERPMAQLLLSMQDAEGEVFEVNPREVLRRVLQRYAQAGLTPVVAVELEFYLLDGELDERGHPQTSMNPATGERSRSTQVYYLQDLADYRKFTDAVADACRAQGVPADTAVRRVRAGAIRDQPQAPRRRAARLRRRHLPQAHHQGRGRTPGHDRQLHGQALRAPGRQRPAPARERARQGRQQRLRLHAGRAGRAAQAGDRRAAAPRARLHAAVRAARQQLPPLRDERLRAAQRLLGLQQPHRGDAHPAQRPGQHAHRTPHRRRRRQSLPGRGGGTGRHARWPRARRRSGRAVVGNAYEQTEIQLRYWRDAIADFQRSEFVAQAFGERFRHIYGQQKAKEQRSFYAEVTSLEVEWYLRQV
jgi:glutamine synthetase